jgi:prepilin-type N-terminal cleavage/methylation domain-containing protein
MRKEAGFTLIEMIVSLILVGIMASVAGMGIVAGVQGYLFAKDNAAVSGKAQLAMSRLNRTFMEVLDITTVGASPTRVTYDRLSGGSRITETLYLDTTGNTIKIASGGNARNPPPTLGWAGFRTFETHFVRSCAGYPLKNVMTTSYFPKFAGTP